MSQVPIGEHALLSDRHSAALVTSQGSVDWLTFPRFDSPAVFARLLDDSAGHWSICPVGDATTSRRYVDRTLVLETTFTTESGVLVLVDLLAVGEGEQGHELGKSVPHALVRRVACTRGEVDIAVEFAPRPEYGLIHPLLTATDGGLTARGGAEWLVLTSPVDLAVEGATASGSTRLTRGQTLYFALHRSTLEQEAARVWSQEKLANAVESTVGAWQSWAAMHQSYEGPWADLVHHSGRVLQGLSFQPSGAIIAAPTTSLPEQIGGGRNWDYRYTWVRDASLTMEALWVAACPDEAGDFFSFMTTAAANSIVSRNLPLQIMFGIGGERDLTERSLPHLSGWRDSSPVRVGNDAWSQQQLDVYGELLGAAHRLRDDLGDLDAETKAFLVALADAAAGRWREQDQGIWEIRGEAKDFVYSKVMCWVALDRAIGLADVIDGQDRVPDWTRARDEIHEEVLSRGWSDKAQSFAQYFDSDELDASNLMLPIVGFLAADDPRVTATIEAVDAKLTDSRGLVYRYRSTDGSDGLEGDEGTFLLCTFWLAQAYALAGRVERAREVFENAVAFVNDVGLLAEEVDVDSGELLGNFPQAFSHIGLINAAYAISEAEKSAADVS